MTHVNEVFAEYNKKRLDAEQELLDKLLVTIRREGEHLNGAVSYASGLIRAAEHNGSDTHLFERAHSTLTAERIQAIEKVTLRPFSEPQLESESDEVKKLKVALQDAKAKLLMMLVENQRSITIPEETIQLVTRALTHPDGQAIDIVTEIHYNKTATIYYTGSEHLLPY